METRGWETFVDEPHAAKVHVYVLLEEGGREGERGRRRTRICGGNDEGTRMVGEERERDEEEGWRIHTERL